MSRHTPTSAAWYVQRSRVLDRDGWTCAYCGKGLVGEDATVDHLTPLAMDPDHNYTDDELVSACRSCNSSKGDRPLVRLRYRSPRWF